MVELEESMIEVWKNGMKIMKVSKKHALTMVETGSWRIIDSKSIEAIIR